MRAISRQRGAVGTSGAESGLTACNIRGTTTPLTCSLYKSPRMSPCELRRGTGSLIMHIGIAGELLVRSARQALISRQESVSAGLLPPLRFQCLVRRPRSQKEVIRCSPRPERSSSSLPVCAPQLRVNLWRPNARPHPFFDSSPPQSTNPMELTPYDVSEVSQARGARRAKERGSAKSEHCPLDVPGGSRRR